ncbi:MAG: alkyl sulfatase dimerization domain-containing protein, partial [Deltaproteobacteria bacterium]
FKGYTGASNGAIETRDGLVLFDTGSFLLSAHVYAAAREFSSAPLHTAVYTHGHVDHVFGVERFDADAARTGAPRPRVIANEAVPARFDRYQLTRGYNGCINRRQFRADFEFPTEFRYPDETFRGHREITVGDHLIELNAARGETDDHTWAWIPSLRTVITGDLFIWASPNAGNPQKVQRYPREWAQALRSMLRCEPEVLLPGHGLPIVGAERVRRALDETATFLETLVEQVLAKMNAGDTLDQILHSVRVPEALLARPYLRPVYDEPEFIVRNIWRLYGGWHDGDPSHLKPSPASRLGREIAALAGGADRLAERALVLADEGDLRLASHLVEFAAQAAPRDRGVWKARARVYAARAKEESSLMARGIFEDAASQDGPRRR